MNNHHVDLMIGPRDWLGQSTPIITNKITAYPVLGQDATLEASTLLFFDGISLGRLKVSDDVRDYITWKQYGKLSLRHPKPKVKVHPGIIHSMLIIAAVSGFGIPLYLREFFYGARQMYKDSRGQDEEVRHNWNLVFNNRNQSPDLRDLVVGTSSYHARRYLPRSEHAFRRLDTYQKETGIDFSSPELHVPFSLAECPFLEITVNYEIPKENVDRVLGIKAKKTSGYESPSIVVWETIDPRFLNPDSAHEIHNIYAITAIKGEAKPYEKLLEISGPKYPKSERIIAT